MKTTLKGAKENNPELKAPSRNPRKTETYINTRLFERKYVISLDDSSTTTNQQSKPIKPRQRKFLIQNSISQTNNSVLPLQTPTKKPGKTQKLN